MSNQRQQKDPHPEITHAAWIDEAASVLGVARAEVDVQAILRLAGRVSGGVARPMVPVSAFLVGLAVGQGGGSTAEAIDRLITTVPEEQVVPREH